MNAFAGLQIDTRVVDEFQNARISVDLASPSRPSFYTTPAFSAFPQSSDAAIPPSVPHFQAKANNRVLIESRKLLAHLLVQLQNRPMPPLLFDSFRTNPDSLVDKGFEAVVETVRAVVKLKGARGQSLVVGDDHDASEDENEEKQDVFTTNVTYDLMVRLKEVLVVSLTQGWQIFHEGLSVEESSKRHESGGILSSPFRRQSLQPTGRRSRSPSPATRGSVHASELLSQCISILASIVSEDCRYKISSPRPTRPPNALQALTLDVAQFLLHAQRHDPKIITQIGFALVPAFTTFHSEMQSRLLKFFEQSIMQGLLGDLRHMQGQEETVTSITHQNGMEESKDAAHAQPPMVSIQIETVQDDTTQVTGASQKHHWLPSTSSEAWRLLSSNAPLQAMSVYYSASLTTPLLSAMLESIDFVSRPDSRLEVLHHFYHLVNTIVNAKSDAYLNCLEVVAYHTTKARYAAVTLLATFWPKVIGHVTVSKPFPVFSYSHSTGIGLQSLGLRDHPYAHQFVPWRFDGSRPRSFDVASLDECRSCSTSIRDFGLLCPFCMSAVHFDCYDYPAGNRMSQYTTNDSTVQKIAMYRFCHVLPARRDSDPTVVRKRHHSFRLVNLFTLSLCFACRKPLWGHTAQCLQCASCLHFAHFSCISHISETALPPCHSNIFNSSHVSIDWSILRSSFSDHYRDALLSEEELAKRTHEEVSVVYAVLWIQLQLLNNGIALGSIVVTQKAVKFTGAEGRKVRKFELHRHIQLYENYLTSGQLRSWPTMYEFVGENPPTPSTHSIIFDWSNLVYISTVIKSPHTSEDLHTSSPDLLNIPQFEGGPDRAFDQNTHPFEVVSLSHMRDALQYEFGISSDCAAGLLLSHLHHLGFFGRLDRSPILFDESAHGQQVYCDFPLPLGLDLSTDVETLVTAVEACLSDVNLSVNEIGFLLLVRKLWPNGMASEYASRRLARNVLAWIVAEDDSLATILRDYLARREALPGVRSGADLLPWPSAHNARPVLANSVNSGGDYIASRRALLNRYGTRWLLALHNQDTTLYATIVYDFCTKLAEDHTTRVGNFSKSKFKKHDKKWSIEYLDTTLRFIVKLSQTTVTFSISDGIFIRWLNSVFDLDMCQEHIPSLSRLFPRETEERRLASSSVDASLQSNDGKVAGLTSFDPWNVVVKLASENRDGLARSLHWLCAFSRAGVDVPVSVFTMLSTQAAQFNASFEDTIFLVEAALSSTWLKSLGRQDLQAMLSDLHARFCRYIIRCLRTEDGSPQAVRFIRQTLAVCLLLYGCERNTLISTQMILDDEVKDLPSRRKMNVRASMLSDPVIVDARLMSALEHYVDADIEDVTCFIAKFLNMFVSESPFLEPHEVDNFILRNGRALCACAWKFYDIQRQDISSIRTAFLLRVLSVDAEPFQQLLQNCFQRNMEWEVRSLAVTRLFRIILDVTSPTFNVEGRQWRSSIIDIFYYYFGAIWGDEKEEIRLAADACSQTLLPSHFDAISLCWGESLAKSPIADRVKLVSFLIQLRPHFPSWRVLTWDGVIETLSENDFDQKNISDKANQTAGHGIYRSSSKNGDETSFGADDNMALLRVSTVLLSLQMISDGITVEIFSLLKIKLHLVQAIGFTDAVAVPSPNNHTFHVRFTLLQQIPDLAIPCINELSTILDAHHPFDLAPSAMGGPYADDDNPWPLLVGAVFVDVLLIMICTIENILFLPDLTVKSMMESLIIVVYKHDLESRPLKHLQNLFRRAIRRILDLLLMEISYDLRQLALSVVQACTKRWSALMGNLVYDAVECVAKLISSQNHHAQDILVAQARTYIDTTITMFSGFFNTLCKRTLDSDFFLALKYITDSNAKMTPLSSESLRDVLLRDTLARAAENDYNSFQPVLHNLQQYIEIVHHQNYSAELMQFVGLCLTMLIRRASEWNADAFDPTPLYVIPAILIQHNKAQSRELLMYTETVVRSALVRFHVSRSSLSRIIDVTSSLYRKTRMPNDSSTGQVQSNNITSAIFEILVDSLRLKTRILPSTLTSILEAMMSPDDSGSMAIVQIFQDPFLADHALSFLQNHMWSGTESEADFAASVAVAKFLLEAFSRDYALARRSLSDLGVEKLSRQSLSVRSWNILAWAALSNPSDKWVSILLAQLSAFSLVHSFSLRAYTQSAASPPPASAITDINHAYISIKLWIMLARKNSLHGNNFSLKKEDTGISAEVLVWNELWPAFESLASGFEAERHAENISTLATLTWSSVADLLFFVRLLRSPLGLELSTQRALLTRLRDLCRGEGATNKLSRALRALSDPPPEMHFQTLVGEAAKEIVVAEKLQALEVGKILAERKGIPERNRREF